MLVLSRHQGDTIVIGDIVITITEIKGNRVRVGVDAPEEIKIYRGEVLAKIQADQRQQLQQLPATTSMNPPIVKGFPHPPIVQGFAYGAA